MKTPLEILTECGVKIDVGKSQIEREETGPGSRPWEHCAVPFSIRGNGEIWQDVFRAGMAHPIAWFERQEQKPRLLQFKLRYPFAPRLKEQMRTGRLTMHSRELLDQLAALYQPSQEELSLSIGGDLATIEGVDSFEDFAANYGYDTDSRKAEKVYQKCLDLRQTMRRMLGTRYEDFMKAVAESEDR